MSEAGADLHLHTAHSDGTFSPEAVVRLAREHRFEAIAITDHDTVAGVSAAVAEAAGDLKVIPGAELTASFKNRELHILSYGMDLEDEELPAFLEQKRNRREQRIRRMIDKLSENGIAVSFDAVKQIAGAGTMGRPHLAEALVQQGKVGSIQEAFHKYLGDTAPCFSPSQVSSVRRVTEVIRSAGGVAVLAHPYRMVKDEWFDELAADGIEGVEAVHSEQGEAVSKRYAAMGRARGLLLTGGSDCHGHRKLGGPRIGTVRISYEWVEALQSAIAARHLETRNVHYSG